MSTRLPAWAQAVATLVAVVVTLGLTSVAPASAAAPDCGPAIYKADGAPWTCTFADDFNGTALDRSKWYVQETATSGFAQNDVCYVNNPANVLVTKGQLNLTLKKSSLAKTCIHPRGNFKTRWTSASVNTFGGFSQTYGRFEWRATFPDGTNGKKPGQHSALWMWPVANTYGLWPLSGEIDVAEWYSNHWDRAIPFLKYGSMWIDPDATNNNCLISYGQPHTFVLEWNTLGLTIKYDGITCLQNTHWLPYGMLTPQPFDKPFMLAMTQLLGTGDNEPSPWKPFSSSTMKVDWVRVWA